MRLERIKIGFNHKVGGAAVFKAVQNSKKVLNFCETDGVLGLNWFDSSLGRFQENRTDPRGDNVANEVRLIVTNAKTPFATTKDNVAYEVRLIVTNREKLCLLQ
uniref:Uncharacterized protein n=1 Tax=Medicago truncatula TaxID=3880 RepID=Q2HT77_MEDTR|nr:hypothetical protein MtrDRAFT_AC150777g4v1 [Medicago truncatula]